MKPNISEIKRINIFEHTLKEGEIYFACTTCAKPYPLHWHSFYEIEYIAEGRGVEVLNGTSIDIKPGTLHVLTPSDFHEFTSVLEPIVMYKFAFTPDLVDRDASAPLYSRDRAPLLYLEGSERALIESFLEAIESSKKCITDSVEFQKILRRQLESVILTAVAITDSEESARAVVLPRYNDSVYKVIDLIHKSFTRPLTLDELASEVYLSPSYVCRRFRAAVGMSIGDYIKRLRMDLAAKLLATTDTSVTAICYEVGFSSASTFSLEFKRIYGVSPIQYRKGNKV